MWGTAGWPRIREDRAGSRQLSAGPGTALTHDLLGALAEETGAGLVVSGAFYLQGDSLRFQAHITDPRRDRLVRAITPASAPVAAPLPAIERMGDRVLGALGPILDTGNTDGHLVHTGRPPSYDAYRAYAQGREAARRGAWREAAVHYERAIALDSTYLAPQLSLAWAMANLGEPAKVDTLVALLDGSRSRLTLYEAATLDQLAAARGNDRLATYDAARRVASLHPGTPSHVQWGIEALNLNRPREAIRTLSGIDPTRGDLRGSTHYWMGLTSAHHAAGNHRRELREARRARRLDPDEPTYLLLEGIALAALGRVRQVNQIVDARLALPDQRLPSAVALMLRIGFELEAHGHAEAAQGFYERAVDWYHRRPTSELFDPADGGLPGASRQAQGYRFDYATALHYARRHAESEEVFRELAAQDPTNVAVQGALGVLAVNRGDRAEAERIDRWLAGSTEPRLRGNHTFLRACIAAQAGRRQEAVLLLQQAFAQGQSFWPRPHFMPCLQSLRGYGPFDALMTPKG